MKLNKILLLLIFGTISIAYGNAGQGIGAVDDSLESTEVAEAVKQEVYLKTSGAEPVEIEGVKGFYSIGGGASPSRGHRHGSDGIGGGASVYGSHHQGIGDGTSTHRKPNSGYNSGIRPYDSGIGEGTQPEHHHHHHDGNSAHMSDQQPKPRGHPHRRRSISEYNRFDSGYSKDCNSYYGRLICYRIYSNPNIPVGNEITCWRVSGNRKNCTEIDNVNYLRREGFTPYESELSRNHNRPGNNERIIQGQSQYYDPYRPITNGADQYPVARNSQKGTHKFSTSRLSFNNDEESLEDGDSTELVRDKRGTRKNAFKNRNQLNRRNRILQQNQQNQQQKPSN